MYCYSIPEFFHNISKSCYYAQIKLISQKTPQFVNHHAQMLFETNYEMKSNERICCIIQMKSKCIMMIVLKLN